MQLSKRISLSQSRQGTILVLAALLLLVMLMFVMLVVDLGVLTLSKNQLQNATDATALAAARELVPDPRPAFPLKSPLPMAINVSGPLQLLLEKDLKTTVTVLGTQIPIISPNNPELNREAVETAAIEMAALQQTPFYSSLNVDLNDIDITHLPQETASPPLLPIPLADHLVSELLLARHAEWPNQVEMTLRCDGRTNSGIPLFFAPVLSQRRSAVVHASASAALLRGYTAFSDAKVLPLAMDITIWRALRLGNGTVNGVPLVHDLLAPQGAL